MTDIFSVVTTVSPWWGIGVGAPGTVVSIVAKAVLRCLRRKHGWKKTDLEKGLVAVDGEVIMNVRKSF